MTTAKPTSVIEKLVLCQAEFAGYELEIDLIARWAAQEGDEWEMVVWDFFEMRLCPANGGLLSIPGAVLATHWNLIAEPWRAALNEAIHEYVAGRSVGELP